jgi:hypothetical protein
MLHGAWQHRRSAVPRGASRHAPSAAAGRPFFFKTAQPTWRQQAVWTLGFCGWVLAGGAALFAIWEFRSFQELLGHDPVRTNIHRPAAPGTYRPAGESGSGCTQAPIDRANGQTTPVDCHTMAPTDQVRPA